LLTAIVKIVTTYTQPGQRVLLLAPASVPTTHPPTGVKKWIGPGPYAGLLEAGWTVVRLGRGIQTHIAGPPRDTNDGGPRRHVVDPPFKSESGPRPHPASPTSDGQHRSTPDNHPDPDRTTTMSGPDRFDLVITAAEPRVLDWLRPTDWANVLTPTGTLAVITHCDRSRGRLDEPAGTLVTAAHRAGLRYHDRIALLRTPIRNGALVASALGSDGPFQPAGGPVATGLRHTQVHDDLLVFTREPAPATSTDGEESSDV
jgi:hypothetical protein